MKAYGVKRKDAGCCPGHDKYPKWPYNITDRKSFKRADQSRKSSARFIAKKGIQNADSD